MTMYALAVVPLSRKLHAAIPEVSQTWLADDATTVGSLSSLLQWWQYLFLMDQILPTFLMISVYIFNNGLTSLPFVFGKSTSLKIVYGRASA